MADRRRPSARHANAIIAGLLSNTLAPKPDLPIIPKRKARTLPPEEMKRRREISRRWNDLMKRLACKAAEARANGTPFEPWIVPVTKRKMTSEERRKFGVRA